MELPDGADLGEALGIIQLHYEVVGRNVHRLRVQGCLHQNYHEVGNMQCRFKYKKNLSVSCHFRQAEKESYVCFLKKGFLYRKYII